MAKNHSVRWWPKRLYKQYQNHETIVRHNRGERSNPPKFKRSQNGNDLLALGTLQLLQLNGQIVCSLLRTAANTRNALVMLHQASKETVQRAHGKRVDKTRKNLAQRCWQ